MIHGARCQAVGSEQRERPWLVGKTCEATTRSCASVSVRRTGQARLVHAQACVYRPGNTEILIHRFGILRIKFKETDRYFNISDFFLIRNNVARLFDHFIFTNQVSSSCRFVFKKKDY